MGGFEELYERVKGVRNIKEDVGKEGMLDIFDEIYDVANFIEQAQESGMEDGEGEEAYQYLEHHIQRARQALVRLVSSDVSGEDIPTCWWEGKDAWDAWDLEGIDDYLGGLVKAEKELLPSAPGAGEAPEEYPSSEIAIKRAELSQKMFGKSPKELTGAEAGKVYRELYKRSEE